MSIAIVVMLGLIVIVAMVLYERRREAAQSADAIRRAVKASAESDKSAAIAVECADAASLALGSFREERAKFEARISSLEARDRERARGLRA